MTSILRVSGRVSISCHTEIIQRFDGGQNGVKIEKNILTAHPGDLVIVIRYVGGAGMMKEIVSALGIEGDVL